MRQASQGDGAVRPAGSRWTPRPPHFAAEGEAVIYLHMDGRRASSTSSTTSRSSQSSLARIARSSFLKGKGSPSSAACRSCSGPFIPSSRLANRALDLRSAAALRESRRQGLLPAGDAHGPVQPRAGRAAAPHRQPESGLRIDRQLGDVWPRQRRIRTCRASSCSSPAASFPAAARACWGSGFLPSVYQGVQCRSQGDPVLFVSNPRA